MARRSVVIIGGGISGLCAAWELSGGAGGPSDDAPRIEIIEASPRFGGAIATTEFAGRTIDLGADGFLARRPEATSLVSELGWASRLEAISAAGASLWLRGALTSLPAGLALGVPTSASSLRRVKGLSWSARRHARRDELFAHRLDVGDDATIGEIVRTKLGDELAYQVVEPLIGGIQAGRIDELSAKSVFPALLDAARSGGSLMKALRPKGPINPGPQAQSVTDGPAFYSLTSGVGSLADELVTQLRDRGVVLRPSTKVTALRVARGEYRWDVDSLSTTTPADFVILATPAPVTSTLLSQYHHAFAALVDVPYAGAAMVTFHVATSHITLPPHGTGVLVPLGTAWTGSDSLVTTAITFLDRKWPHLARDGGVVLRAHVGRSDDQRWQDMSDDALRERVSAELTFLLPRFSKPDASIVQRWPHALPQYLVGHDRLVESARLESQRCGVALCGSAYDGVGIPACIGSGRQAAREALASIKLAGTPLS